MRKLLRTIARANMKKDGIQHINRKIKDGKSFFAMNWRKYC